jgi:cytochrome b6-f complex iron-sulfur subunit
VSVDNQDKPNRREVFVKLGMGSIACACAGAGVFGYSYLSPNVLYEPSPIANVGKPDLYTRGSVTQDLNALIYIVRSAEGFYAMSSTCTHLGCQTVWNGDQGIIACPCHGSKFSTRGVKTEGPAPRPLPWLRMWLSDEGDLLVDRNTIVPQGQYLRV